MPVAAPLVQEPPPSRMIELGVAGGPEPISFRNVPVMEYEYDVPLASGVSVTVTVIEVGVPEQSAFGEQAAVTLCTLDATARPLTSVPPMHCRRSSEFPIKT